MASMVPFSCHPQFVKCTAPGAESSGAHSTARLTGELLALGLSASNLRQLHVRPADPLYLDNLPPISTPVSRPAAADMSYSVRPAHPLFPP